MKIISKFKDYYDSALGFGHDATSVYNRQHSVVDIVTRRQSLHTGTTIDEKHLPYLPPLRSERFIHKNRNKEYSIGLTPFCVYFCGLQYKGITITYSMNYGPDYSHSYYNINTYSAALHRLGLGLKKSTARKTKFGTYNYIPNKVLSEDYLTVWLSAQGNSIFRNRLIGMKHVVSCSVVEYYNGSVSHKNSYHINPKLQDYEFYKIIPSYEAFQEIDMYISGVLPQETADIISIDDEHMREKKGFNDKSFKTPAGTKDRAANKKAKSEKHS